MEKRKPMWKLIAVIATVGGALLTLVADEMERRRVDEEIDQKVNAALSKNEES